MFIYVILAKVTEGNPLRTGIHNKLFSMKNMDTRFRGYDKITV